MADYSTLLRDHVMLTCRSVDRIFLQGYVPKLQSVGMVCNFLRWQRGFPIPSSAAFGKIGDAYVASVHRFAKDSAIPLVHFAKGENKEAFARPLIDAAAKEGGDGKVVLIGIAQEKASVWRSWPAQGHENKAGIAYEALDNGFRSCEDPRALQRICDRLGSGAVRSFLWRWQRRLPSPFTRDDLRAGYTVRTGLPAVRGVRHPCLRPDGHQAHPREVPDPGAHQGRRPPTQLHVQVVPHQAVLRFGDQRVMAVMAAIVGHSHLMAGFRNCQLTELVATLTDEPYTSRQATYDLRRLRRKGLIERLPHSQRYLPTPLGRRVAVLFTKARLASARQGPRRLHRRPDGGRMNLT